MARIPNPPLGVRRRGRAPLFNVSYLAMEKHLSGRAGWLRAAVLGSDDAIVSVSSLMIGVAASSASKEAILVAGVAGLVAGAMSMAVGEYVSMPMRKTSTAGQYPERQAAT